MTKTLVITGGSRGIGRATIERFQQEGYAIINLSRSQPSEEGIIHFTVDLAKRGELEGLAPRLQDAVAGSEQLVLIHNAGLISNDSALQLDGDALRSNLEINVVSAGILNSILADHMGPGSVILYIGSTLSEKAVANAASYVVSKHAIIGLMRATCQDLIGRSIHTAVICPGFTETEMLLAHVGNDQAILDGIASGVIQGRLVAPEEIAATLLFCAENPVINGAVIHANLGQIER